MVPTASSFGDLERDLMVANVDLLSKIKQEGNNTPEVTMFPPPLTGFTHPPMVSTSDNDDDDDDDMMLPFVEVDGPIDHDEASFFSDIAQDDYNFGPVEEEFLQNLLDDDDEDDQLMEQLLHQEQEEQNHQQNQQQETPTSPPASITTPAAAAASPASAMSASWNEYDVILGRCQEVREFIGNVRFRALIDQHRHAYHSAERKAEKTHLSTIIYNMIHNQGGRFLDKKKTANPRVIEWEEIPMDKALAKISQTLRNGTRPVRKHMTLLPAQRQASYPTTACGAFGYPAAMHSYGTSPSCGQYPMPSTVEPQANATSSVVNQR